ncbi:uncharacterized protein LOC121301906 isoform X2 [Polyodon spathula]|uniref:uncharacterized protein LOC121301906 isoform X2 n=1 Tax=Polyodon spathula TaxID=7913 RepID=UPI001B7F5E39|nr:uncharacterized protein LOC121301906 isoform X2 [Polyodon spathula]
MSGFHKDCGRLQTYQRHQPCPVDWRHSEGGSASRGHQLPPSDTANRQRTAQLEPDNSSGVPGDCPGGQGSSDLQYVKNNLDAAPCGPAMALPEKDCSRIPRAGRAHRCFDCREDEGEVHSGRRGDFEEMDFSDGRGYRERLGWLSGELREGEGGATGYHRDFREREGGASSSNHRDFGEREGGASINNHRDFREWEGVASSSNHRDFREREGGASISNHRDFREREGGASSSNRADHRRREGGVKENGGGACSSHRGDVRVGGAGCSRHGDRRERRRQSERRRSEKFSPSSSEEEEEEGGNERRRKREHRPHRQHSLPATQLSPAAWDWRKTAEGGSCAGAALPAALHAEVAQLGLQDREQVLRDAELARRLQEEEEEEERLLRKGQWPGNDISPPEIARFMQRQEMKASRDLEGQGSRMERRDLTDSSERRRRSQNRKTEAPPGSHERLDLEGLLSPREEGSQDRRVSPTYRQHLLPRNIAEELDPTFRVKRQEITAEEPALPAPAASRFPPAAPCCFHDYADERAEPTFIPPTKCQSDKISRLKTKDRKEGCKQQ